MNGLCRDCGAAFAAQPSPARCPECAGRRLLRHQELHQLSIAHLDCDAFYASVEKRDDPRLADRPVIVGGEHRGVVLACCYVARIYGVRSAMPMFKALQACPDAVVIKPDMAKYRTVGREVRELMRATTPLIEPISIDEAFLDLAGTERLHGGSPAQTLARLARRIEREVGITVSIGLSCNKFLAKLASDLDKPRGFAVIGRGEAAAFLSDKPVRWIWGVGNALAARLERDGITRIGQLRQQEERILKARYGAMGQRLWRLAVGEDDRPVDPASPTKSISAETTFDENIADPQALAAALRPLCERVAARLAEAKLAASGVALKLKSGDFKLRTRLRALSAPTQRADTLFRTARALLEDEIDGTRFRLIGIGAERLAPARLADPPDLFDQASGHAGRVENTMAALRARLGDNAIARGMPGLVRPTKRNKDG